MARILTSVDKAQMIYMVIQKNGYAYSPVDNVPGTAKLSFKKIHEFRFPEAWRSILFALVMSKMIPAMGSGCGSHWDTHRARMGGDVHSVFELVGIDVPFEKGRNGAVLRNPGI